MKYIVAQALGISHGSVSTILHDRFGMHRLTARWMPKFRRDDQMATEHQYAAPCYVKDSSILFWMDLE